MGYDAVSAPELQMFFESIGRYEESENIEDIHIPRINMFSVSYRLSLGRDRNHYDNSGLTNEINRLNSPDVMNSLTFGRGDGAGRVQWQDGHFEVVMGRLVHPVE